MFDLISNTLATGFENEMGAGSSIYNDYLLDGVFQKALHFTGPNRSLFIVELPGSPPDLREIGKLGPTDMAWHFQLQLLIKHAKEIEARQQRRVLINRIRRTLYRDPGLGRDLMTLSETEEGITESMTKVIIQNIEPYNTQEKGSFNYMAIFNLRFITST